jgi:hypothetical protein
MYMEKVIFIQIVHSKQISPAYTDKQLEKYIKCQPLVAICTKIAVSIICKQKKNMKIRYWKFVYSMCL